MASPRTGPCAARPPVSVVAGRALQLLRHRPAGLDPGHVRQLVRDPLVAVDAGAIAGDQELAVNPLRARALAGEVHRRRGMAVAAFQRIVGLEPRPLVLREPEPMLLKLLPSVDRAEDVAPDLL